MTKTEYDTVVKSYSHDVYRFALKWMRDESSASDVVQECFLKLWENRKKVATDKAKSWLFTVAHNNMVNTIKKESKMSEYSKHENEEASVTNNYDLRELLEKCIDQLSATQRSVLLMRDLEGYNYNEIGEMLNLNESQVKVYLFRARKKVQLQIKELQVLP